MSSSFTFDTVVYHFELNYYDSKNILPQQFGINLSKIFTDQTEAMQVLQTVTFDDDKAIDLMWHYMEKSTKLTKDDFLRKLNGGILDMFRETFWGEVINFSGPLKKNILEGIWKEFKKMLDEGLPNMISEQSSSDLSPEESLLTTKP